MTLLNAIQPRSIAVLGASDNPNKIGGRPLLFLRRFGFQGAIYAINPSRSEVQGLVAYKDLESLPEVPDLVVVAVPGQAAVDAVEASGRLGVATVVVLSSGFAEAAGAVAGGVEYEVAMRASARAHGMRLIGPNSQGLANFSTGAVPGFSTAFIESAPQDGPVGIVSQSGAMAAVAYSVLRGRGVGVRYVNATGNDCDVSAPELAAEMARDPAIRLVLLYLEGFRDAAALEELGRVARERQVPVVVLKAGRTERGQRAAQSHTGAMANEDRTIDAVLARHGIWRARDVASLVGATELYLNGRKPAGRRVVVISNSGASCVMSADALCDNGLQLAELSAETKAKLAAILPNFASVANPIDITAALLSNNRLFSDILPVIGADPSADAFVIAIPVAGEGYDVQAFAADAAAFAAATDKLVVVAANQPMVAGTFAAAGLPVLPFEAEAVAALAQVIKHHQLLAAPAPRGPAPPSQTEPSGAAAPLNEAESFAVLAGVGIEVADYRLCASPDEAREAFAELGGPVVVKGCSRQAPHKSELGLVRVGLREAAEVHQASCEIMATLERHGLACDGILVARVVSGRRELIAGGRRDPVFGPVLVIGDGGKYVEALEDLQVIACPASITDVREAAARLRIGPILNGVRGEPPIDFAALTEVFAGITALLRQPDIDSIDLNPVFVSEHGAVVADALVIWRTPGADADVSAAT